MNEVPEGFESNEQVEALVEAANQPDLKELIEQDRRDRIKVGTTRVKAVMHELGLQFAVFAVDPDNIPVRIEHALDPRWRVLVNLTVKD